jgi:hypothetical protein
MNLWFTRKHEKFNSPLTPTLSPRKRVERGRGDFSEEKPANLKLFKTVDKSLSKRLLLE